MNDFYTKRLAMFAGAGVEQESGDSRNALTRLAIWLSAGLLKLKKLQLGEPKEDENLLPTLGWTICGYQWSTYIAYMGNKNEDDSVSFFLVKSIFHDPELI